MAIQKFSFRSVTILIGLLILTSNCVDDSIYEPEEAGAVIGFSKLSNQPTVLDQNLEVITVVNGLITPISLAFLGPMDMFVLEKIPDVCNGR
jgi:hypothetical protein